MGLRIIVLVMLLCIPCGFTFAEISVETVGVVPPVDAVSAQKFSTGLIESSLTKNMTSGSNPNLGKMNPVNKMPVSNNPLSNQSLHLLQDEDTQVSLDDQNQNDQALANTLTFQDDVQLAQDDNSKQSDKASSAKVLTDTTEGGVAASKVKNSKVVKKGVDVTNDVAVQQADIEVMHSLIDDIVKTGVVKANSLLSYIMLRLTNPKDINADYALAKGFGSTGSRNTMQSMFGQLAKLKTIKNGKIKMSLTQSVDLNGFKTQFAKNLIQKQLDNNLGTDSLSFQSMYSLPDAQQKQLIARFTTSDNKYTDLFENPSTITDVDKLQLIADMNDEVMNVISGGVALDETGSFVSDKDGNLVLIDASKGGYFGAAQFKTTYDADGNYTSLITMPGGGTNCSVSTVLDAKGNQTSRSLGVGGDEYTVVSRSGWFYGSYKTKYQGSLADAKKASQTATVPGIASANALADTATNKENKLSANDKAIFDNVTDLTSAAAYLRVNAQLAMQDLQANLTLGNVKKVTTTAVKVGLQAGKQAVVYTASTFIPMHIPIASAALLLPIVKLITLLPAMHNPDGSVKSYTGYQFTGHQWSDPTMALVAMKAIDLTVGDKGQSIFTSFLGGKALLSGQGDRLFRQGTVPANALQLLQGKSTQEENVNETYVDGIPAVLQIAFTPFKALFPKTLGSTILSKTDLKKINNSTTSSQSTSAASSAALGIAMTSGLESSGDQSI